MNIKEISVYLDDYEFNCTITHYSAGYPAKTWAIPEHCYPEEPEELVFDVDSVFVHNGEGELVEILDKVEKENIIGDYVDRIESKILEDIREEVEDDFDYPEDDFSQYPDY